MANQPPDPALLQQLLTQGPGGPGGTPIGAPVEAPPVGPQTQGDSGSTTEILRAMIELAKRYIDVDQDPEDKATMAKVLQTLMKYEADEQRERDAALGTSPSQRYLRRGA